MSIRTYAVSLAGLLCALPAAAQQRGTVEFGAFGSAAAFDHALGLKTGYGGGGRVGVYLDPRWSIEFEDAEMRATRPNGLRDVNVGLLSGRLVGVPITSGRLSFVLGAGAGVSTETNFMHSYGVDALVGAKVALRENVALRLDGVFDWLANENWKTYRSVRLGVSVYRNPSRETRVETRTVTVAAAPSVHADSVSAAETRRLRDGELALRALRDSLRNAPRMQMPMPMSPAPAASGRVAPSDATIHFAFDKSTISDSARTILDQNVALFRANPPLTVVIVGYTDAVGTDAYNLALGVRRAEAARSYLVARGVAENRIVVESVGERRQIANSPGVTGEAQNRRAIFRLLIAPDFIAKP